MFINFESENNVKATFSAVKVYIAFGKIYLYIFYNNFVSIDLYLVDSCDVNAALRKSKETVEPSFYQRKALYITWHSPKVRVVVST